MEIFIKIAQFVVCLSLLILIHEMGHFLFARLFKVRVEKFYLFFNPWLSLVRMKKVKGKWQFAWFSKSVPESWSESPETTEWGIGWLPLGGYCKIAGMIDESMDKEQLKQDPQPWEFRTKPTWQRLFIMIGGVVFNIASAMIFFVAILYTWGDTYIKNTDVVNGIYTSTLAKEMGFENGDKILSLDSIPVDRFEEIPLLIIRRQVKEVLVERDEKHISIPIKPEFRVRLLKERRGFIDGRQAFYIAQVVDSMPAKKAGIQEGDKVVGVDSIPMTYYDEVVDAFSHKKGGNVTLMIERNDSLIYLPVAVTEDGMIGVRAKQTIKRTHETYGLLQSIPLGIAKGFTSIREYLLDLKLIFTPSSKASSEVGGFITIANVFPGEWNWHAFWSLCAMISIMLAVVNILPIPALDGGHVLFLLYEIITRRKPSDKFMEYATLVGMIIVFALIIYANGNDIVKLFNK